MCSAVIGQDTLDRIRRETDLVALIGESLKLQKRGRSYVGLCPFHKEKSPSFHVNPERGFYHCFGCHESGDAIKFVQHVEGLEFTEAVQRLAERTGIELALHVTEVERRQQMDARRRSDELFEVMSTAAAWFERMLREHSLAAHGHAELERRALVAHSATDATADALQAFRIGYAPFGWDGLVKHLRESGASLAAAERVGLIASRKSGSGYYDRFRHRLMFAVLDAQGRVIAFSGRALDDPTPEELNELGLDVPAANAEKPAKYYNSPESAIYRKREALFGIYQARQGIRNADFCVLVEGNFDVVSLHARGIKNVIAPLGTAFTLEQAQQIRRFCSDVVFLFDGDEAGRRAVRAAREVCQKVGLSARVATLPDGVDPDDLARKQGAEGVQRVLSAARPLLAFLIDGLLDNPSARVDVVGQAALIREVGELLNSEPDPSVRALAEKEHVPRLAQRLNVSDARTLLDLERALGRTAVPTSGPTGAAAAAAPSPARARSRDRRAEIAFEILGSFLDYPELVNEPDFAEAVALLEGDAAAALAALRQAWERDGLRNPEVVLAKLAPAIHPFARARLAAPRHARPEDARAEVSGNVRQLKTLVLSRDKKTAVEELERAARTGDFEQQQVLLQALFLKARQNKTLVSE